jgi:hypothetical protein
VIPLKTPQVADTLGVGYYRLIGLIRARKLAPPGKDHSGDFCWWPADVERARQALQANRRRQAVSPPTGGPTHAA